MARARPTPTRARPTRRTQGERRQRTIRKLLDAATETLIDLGYARTTVQQISARAGVSQGGMFRHFATREAILVAVGDDVARRILAQFRGEFAAVGQAGEPLERAIRLVRAHCHSRLNRAWFELAVASRTNPALRRALKPTASRYLAAIEALAGELLPELAARFGDRFFMMVDTIVALFDGEVVHHFVVKKPAVEQARLEFLSSLARLLAAS